MAAVLILAGCLFFVGCSDDDGEPGVDAGGQDAGSDAHGFPIEVPCGDSLDSIYLDPGTLPANRGDIIRCAEATPIPMAELQSRAEANGYVGSELTSGAEVYTVLYRTERGNGDPGYSSAIVYMPDHPRADPLPVVIASHGSRGQGPQCAPSLGDSSTVGIHDEYERQVFPLVGAGYAVFAPDLAGYANYGAAGNPPSGYAMALDVARSTLDAPAAMRHLFGSHLAQEIVLVGHSQGGHTALSALALVDQETVDGTIVGAVVYTPLWLNARAWGAVFLVSEDYSIATVPSVTSTTIWYHYTHGEILDGPGHGLDVFAADKRSVIQDYVDNVCWESSYPTLEAVATYPDELFDPAYTSAIKFPASTGQDCGGDAVCEKWIARMVEDRPHLTGTGARVPILVLWGGTDIILGTDRMACVFERLYQDGTNFDGCIDVDADHTTILDVTSDHVNQWIAAVALGDASPTPCANDKSYFIDGAGTLQHACAFPPPND